MKMRKFKDIGVSAIGPGCMRFTYAYGEGPAEEDGIHLVHYAFEKGCRSLIRQRCIPVSRMRNSQEKQSENCRSRNGRLCLKILLWSRP